MKNIIVLEGPSGVGKDTIMWELIESDPTFQKIVSYTDRERRPNEIAGHHYHFIDTKTFEAKIKSGDIFEYTTRHGTYRGMSKILIDKQLEAGKIVIKDCDPIGLNALKKAYPNKVVGIFITADRKVVKQRLENRGGTDIDVRLKDYDQKIKDAVNYDFTVCNNGEIKKTVAEVRRIMEENNGASI